MEGIQGNLRLNIAIFLMCVVAASGCRRAWYSAYGIESEEELSQPKSIPKMGRAARDGYCQAVAALADMGPAAKPAEPMLLDSVRGGYCYDEVAAAIKVINPESTGLVPALEDALKRDYCYAAEVLEKLGPDAARAEATLLWSIRDGGCLKESFKALKHVAPRSEGLLDTALRALERIDTNFFSGIGSQSSVLDSDYVEVVAPVIASFGSKGVPRLVQLMGHERWEVRYCAIRSLAHIGVADPLVKQALQTTANDAEEDVRAAANEALRKMKFSKIAQGADGGQRAKNASIVLAVFDILDPNHVFEPRELGQLTDYLASQITEVAGYKVMPREELGKQLSKQKLKSFKRNFNEKSQIELGKELAAQKSLATQVIRLGRKCAVTANLCDLETKTCDEAFTVDSPCNIEAFMKATKTVAKRMLK
jgi:hypothetical protein